MDKITIKNKQSQTNETSLKKKPNTLELDPS